ncbi:hypothetical protein ANO14919_038350 [Xylariales sp. No.14919]|nr:hypothetical protein ANO14919_038350 [Xylariales sp. No.14919]
MAQGAAGDGELDVGVGSARWEARERDDRDDDGRAEWRGRSRRGKETGQPGSRTVGNGATGSW